MSRKRKKITDATKLAATLACLLPQDERDRLRADRAPKEAIFKLFQFHHIVLHTWEGPDEWWNLHPMPILEHKEQTKRDVKAIAKNKRIRREGHSLILSPKVRLELAENPMPVLAEVFREGLYEGRWDVNQSWVAEANRPGGAVRWNEPRRITSRGFDKTKTKRMRDGKVVERKTR